MAVRKPREIGNSDGKVAQTPVGKSSATTVTASATLKRAGGSLVMTVPAAVRKALGLVEGVELSLVVEGSRVIMEPVETVAARRFRKPKYTLDELVAGMNPDAPLTEDERAWVNDPAKGREVW